MPENKKTTAIIIATVLPVLVVIGLLVFNAARNEDTSRNKDADNNTQQAQTEQSQGNSDVTINSEDSENLQNSEEPADNGNVETTYTLAEIAEHSSESDCWFAIQNKVYDVTNYIPDHPEDKQIVEACGTEATEAFNTKGTKDKPHSDFASSLLADYYIGDLQN